MARRGDVTLKRQAIKSRSSSVHRIPGRCPKFAGSRPIYHPNISEIGMVCLGGYGTHWVPSIQLDELCNMLWDMARYHNYDIRSPYNREAALWVASQTTFLFPTDSRPLRDLRAAMGRIDPEPNPQSDGKQAASGMARTALRLRRRLPARTTNPLRPGFVNS